MSKNRVKQFVSCKGVRGKREFTFGSLHSSRLGPRKNHDMASPDAISNIQTLNSRSRVRPSASHSARGRSSLWRHLWAPRRSQAVIGFELRPRSVLPGAGRPTLRHPWVAPSYPSLCGPVVDSGLPLPVTDP